MELNFNFIILWGSGNGEGGEDENISRYDRYRLVWDDGFTGVYTYKLHQLVSFRYAVIIMLQLHIDKMLELFKIETETSVKENKKNLLSVLIYQQCQTNLFTCSYMIPVEISY